MPQPGEAYKALELLRHLMTEGGLSLHMGKTRLADLSVVREGFDFLGYPFERRTRWPRKKSLRKVREAKTPRSNGQSLPVIIKGVNRDPSRLV